jgi:hypothetical protein
MKQQELIDMAYRQKGENLIYSSHEDKAKLAAGFANDALRMIAKAHRWSWLERSIELGRSSDPEYLYTLPNDLVEIAEGENKGIKCMTADNKLAFIIREASSQTFDYYRQFRDEEPRYRKIANSVEISKKIRAGLTFILDYYVYPKKLHICTEECEDPCEIWNNRKVDIPNTLEDALMYKVAELLLERDPTTFYLAENAKRNYFQNLQDSIEEDRIHTEPDHYTYDTNLEFMGTKHRNPDSIGYYDHFRKDS